MEFPEKPNKSKTFCCVYGCHSKACRDPKIRFYTFPREKVDFVKIINKFDEEEMIDRRQAWIKVLRIGKKVSKYMKVCSLHFIEDDFILPFRAKQHNTILLRLKKTSVPSLNLPPQPTTTSQNTANAPDNSARAERRRQRSIHKRSPTDTNYEELIKKRDAAGNTEGARGEDDTSIGEFPPNEIPSLLPKNLKNTGTQVDGSLSDAATQAPKNYSEIGVQVRSDLVMLKFINFITDDAELSTFTGIHSFELLNTIEELVQTIDRASCASTTLPLRETIIMTFMKFKQNSSYTMLALLFRCSIDTCKQRIVKMIDLLDRCLKPSIVWPSKENILQNLPLSFKGLENVRVVVDCTEIKIQKPSKLCCQIQSYSYSKTSYTIKFMTGVTPAGLISFVSKAYGGRVSDNMILQQSGILEKMDKNDIVMADKGFTVEDLCRKNDVTLLTPFFLRNKKQFTKTEALTNRRIAMARVDVERVNQRLKTFAVLGNTMPICLLSKVEEIFNIICGIVNLSLPILKNDKFCT
ncbi:uncharacterized protein LOC135162241 [Diachasmimorpha longicaudata]|uniref:uncharacterized protein LOC135162241 n=1 Tax=Diachasmimorpha longicaudata TaxID=58733 RepID=UPI0030B8A458